METSQVKIGESYLLTFPEAAESYKGREKIVNVLALLDCGTFAVQFDDGSVDSYWARWLEPLTKDLVPDNQKSHYHAHPMAAIQRLIKLEVAIERVRRYADDKDAKEEVADANDYVRVLELLGI